jgi:hypothetical protein
MMASTYSCSSFSGLVSSKRRWAAAVFGEAEVEQDGLGVAEVQVTVRLGREAGADLGRVERRGGVVGGRAGAAGPAALGMLAGGEVGLDDVLDEIGGGAGVLAGWFGLLTVKPL